MDIHEAIVRVDLLLDIDSTYGSDWDAWQMVRSRAVAPAIQAQPERCRTLVGCISCGRGRATEWRWCPYCGQAQGPRQ